MREGPKPYELLSSKEKEAFELCSEIIRWTSDPDMLTRPGVIKLREDATRLYERVSKMDMEHDDRYYQVGAEIDKLRKQYEDWSIAQHTRRWIQKEFNPESEDVQKLVDMMHRHIRSKSSARLTLYHANHHIGYGDRIDISIWEDEKMKGIYFIDVEELFDHVQYKDSYSGVIYEVLEKLFNKKIKEMATVGAHLHDFGGMQYSTIFRGATPEEVEQIVREVLQIVKAHPRQPKVKK